MDYLEWKWVHVLSSTILFGTGIGTAFQLLAASVGRNPRAVAVVTRRVVWADWLFTAPTIVIQPLTGWLLMREAGLSWSVPWIAWSVALYAIAVACWLPVAWLQVTMARVASTTASTGLPLPPRYWRLLGGWVALGVPAFLALVAIFFLMVVKRI